MLVITTETESCLVMKQDKIMYTRDNVIHRTVQNDSVIGCSHQAYIVNNWFEEVEINRMD